MMQQLIPLTEPDRLLAAGLPFRTTDSARWAFRQSESNGTAAAFLRIGRRVYIDPARYHDLIREHQPA